MPKTDKGWTPVRRGSIYCSPRCGGECTWKAFRAATDNAASLAKRMGGGWHPRVWENLGWHWRIECGPADAPFGRIGCDGYRKYDAEVRAGYMLGPHAGSSSTSLQFWGKGTTPEKAIEAARDSARSIAEGIMTAISNTV